MKKITLGILAHVDSGKTTLSEAFLYATGKIRKLGRVYRPPKVRPKNLTIGGRYFYGKIQL